MAFFTTNKYRETGLFDNSHCEIQAIMDHTDRAGKRLHPVIGETCIIKLQTFQLRALLFWCSVLFYGQLQSPIHNCLSQNEFIASKHGMIYFALPFSSLSNIVIIVKIYCYIWFKFYFGNLLQILIIKKKVFKIRHFFILIIRLIASCHVVVSRQHFEYYFKKSEKF